MSVLQVSEVSPLHLSSSFDAAGGGEQSSPKSHSSASSVPSHQQQRLTERLARTSCLILVSLVSSS